MKANVGDIVQIIPSEFTKDHGFLIGEEVEIITVRRFDFEVQAINVGAWVDYIQEADFELIANK